METLRCEPIRRCWPGQVHECNGNVDLPARLRYYSQARINRRSSHNSWAQWLAETGLVGTAALVYLVGLLVLQGYRAGRALARTWGAVGPGHVGGNDRDVRAPLGRGRDYRNAYLDDVRDGRRDDHLVEEAASPQDGCGAARPRTGEEAGDMRLGFHYHIPASLDAENQNPNARLSRAIRRQPCGALQQGHVFLAFAWSGREGRGLRPGVGKRGAGGFAAEGPCSHRALHSGSMVAPILPFRGRLDVMLIRGPSPLLPQVARAAGTVPVPLLVAGYLAGVDTLPQPRWRKALIRIWSRWNRRGQDKVAARSLVFVNTHVLYKEYRHKTRHLVETRTTTLGDQDFVLRDDACASRHSACYTRAGWTRLRA